MPGVRKQACSLSNSVKQVVLHGIWLGGVLRKTMHSCVSCSACCSMLHDSVSLLCEASSRKLNMRQTRDSMRSTDSFGCYTGARAKAPCRRYNDTIVSLVMSDASGFYNYSQQRHYLSLCTVYEKLHRRATVLQALVCTTAVASMTPTRSCQQRQSRHAGMCAQGCVNWRPVTHGCQCRSHHQIVIIRA